MVIDLNCGLDVFLHLENVLNQPLKGLIQIATGFIIIRIVNSGSHFVNMQALNCKGTASFLFPVNNYSDNTILRKNNFAVQRDIWLLTLENSE